ncbi:MAG: HlyU family transcriptional regulator [Beijerinckiaceae bacterium]
MSFLKKLFGGGRPQDPAEASGASETHNGFTIVATPYETNGRWQLCGIISREANGVLQEHRFVRADNFGTRAEAEEMTLFKARQIIDQMGDRIFAG